MIITGIILIILAALLDVGVLYTIGIILVIVGAVFLVLGTAGRAVGPRRHYW